jgi:hypothetical protein
MRSRPSIALIQALRSLPWVLVQFFDSKQEEESIMIATAKTCFSLGLLVALIFMLALAANSTAGKVPGGQAGASANAAPTAPAAIADANGVIFFDKGTVAQAFAKSATLYNGNAEGRNYRVHTLRRDAPGEVELHTKDTDIFLHPGWLGNLRDRGRHGRRPGHSP